MKLFSSAKIDFTRFNMQPIKITSWSYALYSEVQRTFLIFVLVGIFVEVFVCVVKFFWELLHIYYKTSFNKRTKIHFVKQLPLRPVLYLRVLWVNVFLKLVIIVKSVVKLWVFTAKILCQLHPKTFSNFKRTLKQPILLHGSLYHFLDDHNLPPSLSVAGQWKNSCFSTLSTE